MGIHSADKRSKAVKARTKSLKVNCLSNNAHSCPQTKEQLFDDDISKNNSNSREDKSTSMSKIKVSGDFDNDKNVNPNRQERVLKKRTIEEWELLKKIRNYNNLHCSFDPLNFLSPSCVKYD